MGLLSAITRGVVVDFLKKVTSLDYGSLLLAVEMDYRVDGNSLESSSVPFLTRPIVVPSRAIPVKFFESHPTPGETVCIDC